MLLYKNNIVVTILIITIFPYSAKNKNVKFNPLYSVLKPETSSLSPSAKSKGARFVSATIQYNQNIIKKGKISVIKLLFFITL